MKRTIRLGALSATNIGISFLFQWYVLTKLGPGIETDALFAGMALPQLALAVIGGSLSHVLVPLLAGEDEDRLRQDAWGFLILVGGFFLILATILYLTASWWVAVTLPGFDEKGAALTVDLAQIQLFGMVFSAINGVQWAAYNARQQFVWVECAAILASAISLLLLIWALPVFGVIAAAWGSTLRLLIQTAFLAPGMGRPRWPDLKSQTIRSGWQRIKPLLLGNAYYKTDPLVDRFLLSMASSGSLSLYYLAQQIYGAVTQVINRAIAVPMVPLLSNLYKQGEYAELHRTYHRKLFQTLLISIVGILLLGLVGQTVLELLIGHGNVSASKIQELWWIMILLAGMFMGGVVGQITSSTFYASGDTSTPTRISIISYTAYIPAKVGAFYLFGVIGFAIATSIYYLVNLSLQIYLLEREKCLKM